MKILFTIQHLGSGGAEKVLSLLSNEFVKKGCSVSIVLTSRYNEGIFYSLNENISVIQLTDKVGNSKSKIKKIRCLKQIILQEKPDFVVSFLSHVITLTYVAIRNTHIKFIVSERNNPFSFPKNKLLRFFKNKAFEKADGHVYQTTDAQQYYKEINAEGVVIPNPVELTCNDNWLSCLEKHNEITMVGSKKEEKNRLMAYKAFSIFVDKHPDYILKIYGETTEMTDESVLLDLGIKDRVVFVGKDDDWHSKAIKSRAFILTSDFEGMPNSLLEASALLIPCISTDCPVGGPREILDNGNKGALVKVGDYQELADKLSWLIDSKETQICFARANKNKRAEYSASKIADQWLNYFKKVGQYGKN